MDKPLPVTLLTHEFAPYKGGAATVCEELALAATGLNIPITVWAPETARPTPSTPYPVRRLNLPANRNWWTRFQFRKAFSTQILPHLKPDTLLHLAEPGPLEAWMAHQDRPAFKAFHGRLLLTFHGSELLRAIRSTGKKKRLGQVIQAAKRVHVLSDFTKNMCLEAYPWASEKVLVAPGAPRSFLSVKAISSLLPQFPREKVHFLQVGRIHPRKGQDFILDVISQLPSAIKEQVELWMVGPIIKQGYFKQCARRAQASGVRTHFIHGASGALLDEIYRRSDLFLLPSRAYKNSVEGFGLVNLEASQAGLPILAHRWGGIESTVCHEETGVLIEPNQKAAWVEAMTHLVQNPEIRMKMGGAAKAFAQSFSWTRTAQRVYAP